MPRLKLLRRPPPAPLFASIRGALTNPVAGVGAVRPSVPGDDYRRRPADCSARRGGPCRRAGRRRGRRRGCCDRLRGFAARSSQHRQAHPAPTGRQATVGGERRGNAGPGGRRPDRSVGGNREWSTAFPRRGESFARRNNFCRRSHTGGRRRGSAASGGGRPAPTVGREPRVGRDFPRSMEIVRPAEQFLSTAPHRRPTTRQRRIRWGATRPHRRWEPRVGRDFPRSMEIVRPAEQFLSTG